MMGIYSNTVAVGGTSDYVELKRIFDEVEIPIKISDDPMTVVAKGTAIVAAEPLALEPEVRLKAEINFSYKHGKLNKKKFGFIERI